MSRTSIESMGRAVALPHVSGSFPVKNDNKNEKRYSKQLLGNAIHTRQ